MLEKYKTLYEFVTYCEEFLEINDDDENLALDWIAYILAAKLTNQEILDDARKTLQIYYKWQREAVNHELYNLANIIKQVTEIEINHYHKLSKHLKLRLIPQINKINDELITQYIKK